MRKIYSIFLILAAVLPLLVASCSHSDPRTQALTDLRDDVEDHLEALTPGDWIIIGPTPAMERATKVKSPHHVSVLASNVNTLRETLDLLENEDRLTPRIWVCRELEQADKRRTPGSARLRTHLNELLTGRTHFSVDERMITLQLKMLPAEKQVLFIHTDTTLPFSSIGIELDTTGTHAAAEQINTPRTGKPAYQHADLKP